METLLGQLILLSVVEKPYHTQVLVIENIQFTDLGNEV